MNDLIEFQRLQIEALQREVFLLNEENVALKSVIFEVTDKQCTTEFKKEVKREIFEAIEENIKNLKNGR